MLFTTGQLAGIVLACISAIWLVEEAGIGAMSTAGVMTFICGSYLATDDDDND